MFEFKLNTRPMKTTPMLTEWQERLELTDVTVQLERIDPDAVAYADSVPGSDRYFIGIALTAINPRCYTLYHDRDLADEDICHELLHVKFPDASEELIVKMTELTLKVVAQEEFTYASVLNGYQIKDTDYKYVVGIKEISLNGLLEIVYAWDGDERETVGGWFDAETEEYVLDFGVLVRVFYTAVGIAYCNNQKAIWSIEENKAIRL